MIKVVEINGRRWYEDEQNHRYPSASSVLDVLFPDSTSFIPEDALIRGSLCHAEIARAAVAIAVRNAYPEHEDPAVRRRISAAIQFIKDSMTEIYAVESPILFMGVGMTPDLVGLHRDGYKFILDWKFAESVAERYLFQAEFYGRAERANRAMIVQITREAEVYRHPVPNDPTRWELIKSAINVRNHFDGKEKKYVG